MNVPTLTFSDLFRADVRTSREADELNTRLQSALGLDFRYQAARLALALSLGDPAPPPAIADLLGKPIRGETLFGQEEVDLALWAALVVEHDPVAATSRRSFLDRTAAHWDRGARRLSRTWAKHHGTPETFLLGLGRSDWSQRTVESTVKSV